jgi:ORF6N domain
MVKKPLSRTDIIPIEVIERRIYVIRGHKVMLDRDLADLYEVSTKVFNQAVKRNLVRFPEDFMFQLSKDELENWRSQIVTSNPASKMGLRRPPYAFTQEGLAMLSSVLNSDRAIAVNIAIMRAFVKLREMIVTNKDLAHKIEALERQYSEHDQDIQIIFKTIKKLLEPPTLPPEPSKEQIGFRIPDDDDFE